MWGICNNVTLSHLKCNDKPDKFIFYIQISKTAIKRFLIIRYAMASYVIYDFRDTRVKSQLPQRDKLFYVQLQNCSRNILFNNIK